MTNFTNNVVSIITLMLLSAIPFCLFANAEVDSLRYVVNNSDGAEKAEACLALCDKLKFSNQAEAQSFCEKGIALTESLSLAYLSPKLYRALGVVHTIQGNFDTAIDHYNQAIRLFEQVDNAAGIGRTYSNLGLIQSKRGEYYAAAELYDKAIVLFEALNDTTLLMMVKGNVANLSYMQGDYTKALITYEELLNYAYLNNNKPYIARYLSNIGRVRLREGNYPEALRYYYDSKDVLGDLDNKSELAILYNDIGIIYSNLQMNEQAIQNFMAGLALQEIIGNDRQKGQIHTNLSGLHWKSADLNQAYFHVEKALKYYENAGVKAIGNPLQTLALIQSDRAEYDSAIHNLTRAINIAEELGQKQILGGSLSTLGRVYLAQEELGLAEEYLKEAEIILEELGGFKALKANADYLWMLYEQKGAFEQEADYRERARIYKDSLYGLERNRELVQLEIERLLTERDETKSNAAKESEYGQSSLANLWIVVSLIVLLLGILIVKKRKDSEQKLKGHIDTERAQKEALAEALKKKNLEMTFLSLSMVQKDDFLKKMKSELIAVSEKYPENKEVRRLINSVQIQDLTKKDWEIFKDAYEQVFPDFFDKLIAAFPNLSSKELRHCALIRLKIPLTDMANILGISINSVHKARHRLRAKFQINRKEKLEVFISKF